MFVHAFSAYFGLAVHFVLQRRCYCKKYVGGGSLNHQFSSITYSTVCTWDSIWTSTDEISTFCLKLTFKCTKGTLFLWLLWPSFNACLAKEESEQFRAIINTYYSLAASCVTAFAVSTLLSNCSFENETADKELNMASSCSQIMGWDWTYSITQFGVQCAGSFPQFHIGRRSSDWYVGRHDDQHLGVDDCRRLSRCRINLHRSIP